MDRSGGGPKQADDEDWIGCNWIEARASGEGCKKSVLCVSSVAFVLHFQFFSTGFNFLATVFEFEIAAVASGSTSCS